jgi:hypothetical protein
MIFLLFAIFSTVSGRTEFIFFLKLKLNFWHFKPFVFFQGSNEIFCDFESDLCGYESNKIFQRFTGKSGSLTSGPNTDATNGIFT